MPQSAKVASFCQDFEPVGYNFGYKASLYPQDLIDARIRLEHALGMPTAADFSRSVSRVKETMSVQILIVDDSPHIRAYVRTFIEANTDWTVCEAENGEIALTMVVSLKPHFVVLDLSMPGMNGLETARRISVISHGLPMIMFTMHDSRLLLKEAQAVGITHVFSKENGFGDNVLGAMKAMLPG